MLTREEGPMLDAGLGARVARLAAEYNRALRRRALEHEVIAELDCIRDEARRSHRLQE
jgi:hypothetical protein